MLSKIKSHLKDANKTYFEHQKFALKVSWKCLCSSFTALIHSICPALFEYTTSSKIKEMQHLIKDNIVISPISLFFCDDDDADHTVPEPPSPICFNDE